MGLAAVKNAALHATTSNFVFTPTYLPGVVLPAGDSAANFATQAQ